MNEIFDFNRWVLLVKKHWSENQKKYLLSLLAIAGILILWYSFMLLMERHNPYPKELQLGTYYIGMGLIGSLFGSLIFADLAGGPKAMHFLSLPASMLEKLMCALLFAVLLFFTCYTVIFHLVEYMMVNVANNFLESYWAERNPDYEFVVQKVVNVFSGTEGNNPDGTNFYIYFLLLYINLQSAFILGSVYFTNYNFVKTCVSVLLVFLFFVFFVVKVLYNMMPPGSYYNPPFTTYRLLDNSSNAMGMKLGDWIGYMVEFLFKYGFAPLFWVVTYFRLKEKEV